jgi:hypothetical protein
MVDTENMELKQRKESDRNNIGIKLFKPRSHQDSFAANSSRLYTSVQDRSQLASPAPV